MLRVVPQSARWLLTKDRKEEAIALLQKAARVNGRVLPSTLQAPAGIEVDYTLNDKSLKKLHILSEPNGVA